MDIMETYFSAHPSQRKVVKLLMELGIRVEDAHAYCGDIKQGDCAIGEAAGVDRRVVRAALTRISSIPELDAIFSKLRCTLSMVDLAPEIGCSSIVISPTDAKMPGILAEITAVLYKHGVSVRQAMVDENGPDGAVFLVVVYGRIPDGAISEIRACRGVSSVLIK
ncbi:regulator of amino acid metabolism, contains ACT domain protein [Candidatus Methanoprimaticola sp. MG2]|uniref:regulator of amino acid metabolism, contains ACT domain protein n=1 Tax=Candidatus Methanoprimaticola sp. MG2 TaxID=3228838 RepID=UPI0039C6E1E3